MEKIITINRQFGSGGREVGKRLADALGIGYYDHELIGRIAEDTNFAASYIEQHSESTISRHYPLTFGRTFSTVQSSPSDTIHLAQSKIIRELADQGNCVIVGRCSDYILSQYGGLRIFVYSTDMDARIERCYRKVPEDRVKSAKEMQKEILGVDKRRAKYHSYYTGREWTDMNNYNLCIDTGKIGIKNAVNLILTALED